MNFSIAMVISVAMCTFNGSKYIVEQLESILQQSFPVDEIVICDDCSTDDTVGLINDIIDKVSSVKIRLVRNSMNIGLVRNFAQAISLCNGDIIFLSDQDDIWMQDKVHQIVSQFSSHPEMDLISTDAELVNECGKLFSSESLWEVTRLCDFNKYKSCDLLPEFFAASGRITGATVAFRNKPPYSNFMTFQGDFLCHDEPITIMSVVFDAFLPIPQKLMKYRLSSGQSCGLQRGWFNSDIRLPHSYVYNFRDIPLTEKWSRRLKFIEERMEFKRHPFRILKNFEKYRSCYGKNAMSFVLYDCHRTVNGLLHKMHLVS